MFHITQDKPTGAWTKEILHEHLKVACLLEHSTIPLYLYAAYSIKDPNHPAYTTILDVVKQEMLHLSLAGNLLRATGGKPQLFGADSTPAYPATIFKDSTPVILSEANEAAIKLFVKIEEPVYSSGGTTPGTGTNVLPDYDTIADFYDSILEGLAVLSKDHSNPLFDPASQGQQFGADKDNVWYYPDLKPILNLQDAEYAMKLIIQQGEGGNKVQDPEHLPSHYEAFKSILSELPETYTVIESPKTKSFEGEDVYVAMQAVDAVYSYLLLSIQKLWSYDGPSRESIAANNIMGLMSGALPTLARFLVTQPTKREPGKNAAPPFNCYPFDPANSFGNALNQLKEAVKHAIDKFPDLKGIQGTVDALVDLGKLGT
ncbi:hypothetical protein FRC11_014572 [Ceratobasidium sp. 423]|nr:hypothetical protein FRC11_014572 [Ceratobasidium sp. 423]